MVHRSSDSRLLTTLLTHEKEYHKHLLLLVDNHSQQSLSSFAAYASASSAPVSRVIIGVAGSLAGADEALRRYAQSVQVWQDELHVLKDLEEEVNNILRDREILVSRLIKLSKSQKPTRDSFVGSLGPSPSTLSQTSLNSMGSIGSPASTKLGAAQAELQACETHLAAKERELDALRVEAVRRGLQGRCKAMVECGWTWGEMGKEGLRALEGINPAAGHDANKPLPDPDRPPGSDLSSLGPSQSASQIYLPISPLNLAADQDHTYFPNPSANPTYPPLSPPAQAPLPESPTAYTLQIPPAHSISEFAQPPTRVDLAMSRRISEVTEPEENSSDDDQRPVEVVENTRFASVSQTRLAPEGGGAGARRHFSLRQHNRDGSGTTSSATGTGTGSFVQPAPKESWSPHGPLRLPSSHPRNAPASAPPIRDRKTSGFFGSIAGLFRHGGGGGSGSKGDKWNTRTAQNVRNARRGSDSDSDEEEEAAGGSSSRWAFRRRASEDVQPRGSPNKKLKRKAGSAVEYGGGAQQQDHDSGWISDGAMVGGAGARKGSLKKHGLSRKQLTEQNTRSNSNVNLPIQNPSSPKPSRPISVSSPPNSSTPQPKPRPKSHQSPSRSATADTTTNLRVEAVKRSGELSRQGSVRSSTSAASAPINGASRTAAPRRSASVTRGPGLPPSKSENSAVSSSPAAASAHGKAKSKAGTWSSAHPDVGRGGQMSLMAIVEGVSRDNRAGWDRASAGVGPLTASGSGGLLSIRAPPSVDKYNLRGDGGKGLAYETVFMPAGTASGANSGASLSRASSTRTPTSPNTVTNKPVSRSNSTAVAGAKASPPHLTGKMPLRSALRNPSPPRAPLKPLVVPSAPPKLLQPVNGNIGGDNDTDTSSISSYETGHEEMEDTETDAPPPPPEKEVAAHGQGDSDVSTSTIDASGQPGRRKSVRMSLRPTFSPTPPAVDEDSEDVWGLNGHATPTANGGFKGGHDVVPEVEEVRGREEKDMWEDSSSEDEEYRRAKTALKKVGRKKW
ncbi:hypothetical protein FA95DRAFT_1562116 [Auriscalpium vulgare]|uniref:Uncharacterized protein n=1 Tax=Auriscalpium vulgare TaxID=40419 RepID=A0ACB8RLP9_9AGAM|nr:hypothetical protein FA95DRAFT_1562116 [Auriscalpium vulgare]